MAELVGTSPRGPWRRRRAWRPEPAAVAGLARRSKDGTRPGRNLHSLTRKPRRSMPSPRRRLQRAQRRRTAGPRDGGRPRSSSRSAAWRPSSARVRRRPLRLRPPPPGSAELAGICGLEQEGSCAAGGGHGAPCAAPAMDLESGLYLVATPIGNLEDITLRALRVLKCVNVILSEDTRHSGKLLQHYNIKTPLLSFHKFNEREREPSILRRLHEGEAIALISDAGTPGISDPGMELARLCAAEKIPVVPIPGPSAASAALSASGLLSNEFTFVGFLPKHARSRRDRLEISAREAATQIFYVPPHGIHQFLVDAASSFGDSRSCVIAREITKLHEEFWRGSLGEANEAFATRQPKGEITVLIEGQSISVDETPSEEFLEHELRELTAKGHTLSAAVKLVTEATSAKKKDVYALALRLFGK